MSSRASFRASRSEYMYVAAAPDLFTESGFDYTESRPPRVERDPVPGRINGIFRMVILVSVVIAMVCCLRVGLAAASVGTAIEAETLDAQIEQARSLGSDLEVQQSRLTNSTQLRVSATGLGMVAPESTVTIVLDEDVVVTDTEGDLSFSGTTSAIANQA